MAFFSRPNLGDIQFEQTPNTTLSLSGLTSIKSITGFTLSSGNGSDILVTVSGASTPSTNGYVLTYENGSIELKPSSVSGTTSTFNTNRYVTRSGIPDVCVGGVCTINNFLEKYFFPAIGPTTTLSASNNTREFGDSATGTLSYTINKNTNDLCAAGVDTTGNAVLNCFPITTTITGSSSGSYSYSFPIACAGSVSGLTGTSINYELSATTVVNESSISTANVTWENKKYYFISDTLYSASDELTLQLIARGLTGTQAVLSQTKSANLTLTFNNEFFYYMYPTIFGSPVFTINNIPNNAWGSSDISTLFVVTYINTYGYTNQYYVARSDNRITGTYIITIA